MHILNVELCIGSLTDAKMAANLRYLNGTLVTTSIYVVNLSNTYHSQPLSTNLYQGFLTDHIQFAKILSTQHRIQIYVEVHHI